MTEISLIEVYRIVDSFFKYFEGNFLVAQISSFGKLRCAFDENFVRCAHCLQCKLVRLAAVELLARNGTQT